MRTQDVTEATNEYELLGVLPDCSDEELEAAYRRKVKEWHPDRLQSMAQELRDAATRKLAQINGAYERLKSERQTTQPSGAKMNTPCYPDLGVGKQESEDPFEKQRSKLSGTNTSSGDFNVPIPVADDDEPPITVGWGVAIASITLLLCIIDFALHGSGEVEGSFSDWLPLIAAVAVGLLFVVYFWRKATRRPKTFVDVALSIIGCHVKLTLTFGIGFVLAVIAVMSVLGEAGAYSESMRAYGKGPELARNRSLEGKAWHGIATFLAPFALLVVIFSSAVRNFYFANLTTCNLALFGLYLLWLWFTVWTIVQDGYPKDDRAKRVLLSLGAIGTWAVVVAASTWGIRWLLAAM